MSDGPPEPGRPLRWLHLSDLHLSGEESWDRRRTLKALLRDVVEAERKAGRGPDLVFVTGDVAERGREEDCEVALAFLRELADQAGLAPPRHLFVVPGNHDVDRGRMRPPHQRAVSGLEEEGEVEEILCDGHSARPAEARRAP